MITIKIQINGKDIESFSAQNITREVGRDAIGCTPYRILDIGEIVYHKREKGATVLAHEILEAVVTNRDLDKIRSTFQVSP